MERGGRFGVYGLIGWGLEVCYTAGHAIAAGKGDGRLQGESYVWMFPVYGAGGLAGEAVHEALATRPVWQRAVAYAATFWTIEAASGAIIRRVTGDVPWGPEYRQHRDQLGGGLIRMSYFPQWAIAGLALEHVAPIVRRLELGS